VIRRSGLVFEGRALVAGSARGRALVLDEPLSFWGGVDSTTGQIIDHRHPQAGANVRGTVLAMASGRGSSSSSTVLVESIRARTGPIGIVLMELDEILVLGAIVAEELYARTVPVVILDEAAYQSIALGDLVTIEPSGKVCVVSAS